MQEKISFCYLDGSTKFLRNSAPAYQTARCHIPNESSEQKCNEHLQLFTDSLSAAQMILLNEMGDTTKRDGGNSGAKCRHTKPKSFVSTKETTTMLTFQFLEIYTMSCISVVTTA
jgi:hypothetical protein